MSAALRLTAIFAGLGTASALALLYYVAATPAATELGAPTASKGDPGTSVATAARVAPVAPAEAVAAQRSSDLDVFPPKVATLRSVGTAEARSAPGNRAPGLPEGVRPEDVVVRADGLATAVRTNDATVQAKPQAMANALPLPSSVRPGDVVVDPGGVPTVIRLTGDENAARGGAAPSVPALPQGVNPEDVVVGPDGVAAVVRLRESRVSAEQPRQEAVAPNRAGAYAVSPLGVPTLVESTETRNGAR